MKQFLTIAAISGGMIASVLSQDDVVRKARELSRDKESASLTVEEFEKALSRNDLDAIKRLLVRRISDEFKVDQISREVDSFANGDAKVLSRPGKIVGPLSFKGNKAKTARAVIRTKVELNGEKSIRSYFLEKEEGDWRIIFVSPSTLDGFFLLTLKGSIGNEQ